MLTEKKRLIFLKKLFPILIISICLLMSIGYATVNDVILSVEGEAVAMIPEGIYVTDISFQNSIEADYVNSNINVVNNTLLNHKIILSSTDSDSYIKYKIEIFNGYDYDWEFKGVSFDPQFYDNSDITYTLDDTIHVGDLVKSHEYVSLYVTFKYKDGIMPSELNNVLNAHINYEFIPCAILMATSKTDTSAFRSSDYKEDIINITFEDEINIPTNAVESWDIGVSQTGDVVAFVVESEETQGEYDLYIQSDTQLYGNKDMSYWFKDINSVESINGLNLLDTSNVSDMSYMFQYTGYNNPDFTLDVSNLDTSNTTIMEGMFYETGYNSSSFTLDLSGFDTGKVTDMSAMFYFVGRANSDFTLDVSNFDISKVTDMSEMFAGAGFSSSHFVLNLGENFDTSSVTDMSSMFNQTGYDSLDFTLDVSNFNTSKVRNMAYMFSETGYSSRVITLDLSGFDTRNVTNMAGMFHGTGYSNPNFVLDIDNFDTSSVVNMSRMFQKTGYKSTIFTLDVSNFDTSYVTNMQNMFYQTGFNSTKLNTEITIKNPNITTYATMFYDVATQSGSQIIVNYTNETSDLVDQMILTKSSTSNVVKGYNLDSIISFTFVDTTYNAYEGMTWEQWVNSEFNTGGFVIPEGYTVVSHPQYVGIMFDSSNRLVLCVDRIIRDEIYIFTIPDDC